MTSISNADQSLPLCRSAKRCQNEFFIDVKWPYSLQETNVGSGLSQNVEFNLDKVYTCTDTALSTNSTTLGGPGSSNHQRLESKTCLHFHKLTKAYPQWLPLRNLVKTVTISLSSCSATSASYLLTQIFHPPNPSLSPNSQIF